MKLVKTKNTFKYLDCNKDSHRSHCRSYRDAHRDVPKPLKYGAKKRKSVKENRDYNWRDFSILCKKLQGICKLPELLEEDGLHLVVSPAQVAEEGWTPSCRGGNTLSMIALLDGGVQLNHTFSLSNLNATSHLHYYEHMRRWRIISYNLILRICWRDT